MTDEATRCIVALDAGPVGAVHIRDVARPYQCPRFDGRDGFETRAHELSLVHIDGEDAPRLVARERVAGSLAEAFDLVPEPMTFDAQPASAPYGCALGGTTHGQLR